METSIRAVALVGSFSSQGIEIRPFKVQYFWPILDANFKASWTMVQKFLVFSTDFKAWLVSGMNLSTDTKLISQLFMDGSQGENSFKQLQEAKKLCCEISKLFSGPLLFNIT